MLSKKKDSGLNEGGIAGKYVKRDTPPILRSKFMFILQGTVYIARLPCVGTKV